MKICEGNKIPAILRNAARACQFFIRDKSSRRDVFHESAERRRATFAVTFNDFRNTMAIGAYVNALGWRYLFQVSLQSGTLQISRNHIYYVKRISTIYMTRACIRYMWCNYDLISILQPLVRMFATKLQNLCPRISLDLTYFLRRELLIIYINNYQQKYTPTIYVKINYMHNIKYHL